MRYCVIFYVMSYFFPQQFKYDSRNDFTTKQHKHANVYLGQNELCKYEHEELKKRTNESPNIKTWYFVYLIAFFTAF